MHDTSPAHQQGKKQKYQIDYLQRLVIYMWIKTEFMIADIGTKFVSQTVYKALVPKM